MSSIEKDVISAMMAEHPVLARRLGNIAGRNVVEKKQPRRAIATQTGIISFDIRAGGGLPAGLIELYGPRSCGKTATLGQIVSFAQRTGMTVAWVASEYFDEPYLKNLGVDTDELPLILGGDPDAANLMLDFVSTNSTGLLAVDSATALRPKGQEAAEWNEMMLELVVRMRALLSVESCVVMTSQVRTRRSVDARNHFGGIVDSASRRLADLFAMRLELTRTDVSETEYTQVINIVANTIGPPATVVEIPAKKGHGADLALDLVRVAGQMGMIERRGPKRYLEDQYLGIGEKGAAEQIAYDPDLQLELIGRILENCMEE
jgi:recombination protein RecA